MANLIYSFNELRDILYNYGVCAESSACALRLQTRVSHYFAAAAPHLSLRDRQTAWDLVERVDRLMISVIGVDAMTCNGFWISRLNNLQNDLFTFLRQLKMCGRKDRMNFETWYSMCHHEYETRSYAYQGWTRLKDQRNHMLDLTNLPITRHFRAQMNIAMFKGVYMTRSSGPGRLAMSHIKRKMQQYTAQEEEENDDNDEKNHDLNTNDNHNYDCDCRQEVPAKRAKLEQHQHRKTPETSIMASHLACAVLPYDREFGVSVGDWQYARATFRDPDDIRLLNITKRHASLQFHSLELERLSKKYNAVEDVIVLTDARRLDICRRKLNLLCDWIVDETPIIVD